MYLTVTNLPDYLIGRSVIDAGSVVDGDFAIVEAGRRNRNFKVLRGALPGLFVKQVANTWSWEPIMTLQREAGFYALLRDRADLAPVARIAPRLVDHNPANCSLIVELLPEGENLNEYHARLGSFPEDAGAAAGRALAAYHHEHANRLNGAPAQALFPRQLPWILNLDPTTFAPLSQFGATAHALIAAMQQRPALLQHLSAMRYEWQFDSVIHGDMKWDNLLIQPGADGKPELRIVDWELVDIGDASWDVGAIFAAYLTHWMMIAAGAQIPAATGAPPLPLAAVQPALRAFWSTYAALREIQAAAQARYLERCMRFAAARLVLIAFEYVYNAPQTMPHALNLLQLSQNLFLNPRQGAGELVGAQLPG